MSLYEKVTIAGFGGQGIIMSSKLLAQTAMEGGKEVTLMPSYGAEVRGGTANCMIVIADEPVASPVVAAPSSLIAMNKASLDKFAPKVNAGGMIIVNSSLIDTLPNMDKSIRIIKVPADKIARQLGVARAANMVALGAYLGASGILTPELAASCLEHILAKRYHNTIGINTQALKQGAEHAAAQLAA